MGPFQIRQEGRQLHRAVAVRASTGNRWQLGVTVYFATPHHAWERGTNENTNGLLRQYLPKGTCLGHLTQRQCDDIAAKLNHRPRRRLDFRTPHEVYYGSVRPSRR